MNIAGMAQNSLALLMMISWFRFARFDVLEDRRSAGVLELSYCHGNRVLDSGQSPTHPPTLSFRESLATSFSISWTAPGAATG
jgi:hypothetical protein